LPALPYKILYIDADQNLTLLDLAANKTQVLAERVGVFVPDWPRQRLFLTICDPDPDFAEQGAGEVALYSFGDGSLEVFGSYYMGAGLELSPGGGYLALSSGLGGMEIYDLERGEHWEAGDNGSLFIYGEWPLWSPKETAFAFNRLVEGGAPLGVYIADLPGGKTTLVLEATPEERVRVWDWPEKDELLLEFEPTPQAWDGPDGPWPQGTFKLLDLGDGTLTQTAAPVAQPLPRRESPDGAWLLREEGTGWFLKDLWLENAETGARFSLGQGVSPCWYVEP
jgi:hypothetical protein